jgi:hypothetical protein
MRGSDIISSNIIVVEVSWQYMPSYICVNVVKACRWRGESYTERISNPPSVASQNAKKEDASGGSLVTTSCQC